MQFDFNFKKKTDRKHRNGIPNIIRSVKTPLRNTSVLNESLNYQRNSSVPARKKCKHNIDIALARWIAMMQRMFSPSPCISIESAYHIQIIKIIYTWRPSCVRNFIELGGQFLVWFSFPPPPSPLQYCFAWWPERDRERQTARERGKEKYRAKEREGWSEKRRYGDNIIIP